MDSPAVTHVVNKDASVSPKFLYACLTISFPYVHVKKKKKLILLSEPYCVIFAVFAFIRQINDAGMG